MKECAVCGQQIDENRFHVSEHWSKPEVEAHNIGQARLARADQDGNGNYVFYFCRWRHLGDFQSECGLESHVRRAVEDYHPS